MQRGKSLQEKQPNSLKKKKKIVLGGEAGGRSSARLLAKQIYMKNSLLK